MMNVIAQMKAADSQEMSFDNMGIQEDVLALRIKNIALTETVNDLSEQVTDAKEIINEFYETFKTYLLYHKLDKSKYADLLEKAKPFLKEIQDDN